MCRVNIYNSYLTNLIERKANALKKSKLILCCLTKCFLSDSSCVQEFVYAARLHKIICVLLLEENLKVKDIFGIEFIFKSLQYVKCFEYASFIDNDVCLGLIEDAIGKHFRVRFTMQLLDSFVISL